MKRILVLAAGILALSACNDDADEDPTLAQYNADIRTIDNYLSENGISAENFRNIILQLPVNG